MYGEILRYMGHPVPPEGDAGVRLNELISSSLIKLSAASVPRHVKAKFSCTLTGDKVTIGVFNTKSRDLAVRLKNCKEAFLFAASLGADVDRLISQSSVTGTAEALCLQACAAAEIENYCNGIECEIAHSLRNKSMYPVLRFSPGYGDFDIGCQSLILDILKAQKYIGLTVTEKHILAPLKSVTAVIGISAVPDLNIRDNCKNCAKENCTFRQKRFIYD